MTGFWAFLLFLIQPDTFQAIMSCFGLRKGLKRRSSFLSITASRPQRPHPLSPTLSPALSPVSGPFALGDFGELRGEDDDFSLDSHGDTAATGTFNDKSRHKTHCRHLSKDERGKGSIKSGYPSGQLSPPPVQHTHSTHTQHSRRHSQSDSISQVA